MRFRLLLALLGYQIPSSHHAEPFEMVSHLVPKVLVSCGSHVTSAHPTCQPLIARESRMAEDTHTWVRGWSSEPCTLASCTKHQRGGDGDQVLAYVVESSPEAPSHRHSQDLQGESTKQRFGAFKKLPKKIFHGTRQTLRAEIWTNLLHLIPPLLFEKSDTISSLNPSPSKTCVMSCTS